MRIQVVCVGRLKAGAERELVARYLDRAKASGRALGFAGFDVIEVSESVARRGDDRMAEEGLAILAAVPSGARIIVLDPRGRSVPSVELATRLATLRDSGVAATSFVIGGADGVSDAVRGRADLLLAFGAATFPHQLVRVMVAEQVYRATTILAGHPYHRA